MASKKVKKKPSVAEEDGDQVLILVRVFLVVIDKMVLLRRIQLT
jgi:hypothetical protein